MSTIASLMVGMGADADGLAADLKRAERSVVGFVRGVSANTRGMLAESRASVAAVTTTVANGVTRAGVAIQTGLLARLTAVRTAIPLVAEAFGAGIAKMATSITKGQSMIGALQNGLEDFAQFIGPAGVLSIAVLATGVGIGLMFKKARDELYKTQMEYVKRIDEMRNAATNIPLQQEAQRLVYGTPSQGAGAGGGARGSIADLQARIRMAQKAQLAAATRGAAQAYTSEIKALTTELAPLVQQYNEVMWRLRNPVAAQPDIIGAAPVRIEGITSEQRAKDAAAAQDKMWADKSAGVQRFAEMAALAARNTGFWDSLVRQVAGNVASTEKLIEGFGSSTSEAAGKTRALQDAWLAVYKTLTGVTLLTREAVQGLVATSNIPIPAVATGKPTIARPDISPTMTRRQPIGAELTPTATSGLLSKLGIGPELAGNLTSIFSTVGSGLKTLGMDLMSAFGPLVFVAEFVGGVFETLGPALQAFMLPVRIAGQIFGALLVPSLRLLFPVIRTLGVVLLVLGEAAARISAVIYQAAGQLLVGIGRLINLLPGSLGKPLINLGRSLLNTSTDLREAAHEMGRSRKELSGMTFDDAMTSVKGLGDAATEAAEALRFVPAWFKVERARFDASLPVPGTSSSVSSGAASAGVTFTGPVVIQTNATNADELLDGISRQARSRARAYGFTSIRAADVLALAGV